MILISWLICTGMILFSYPPLRATLTSQEVRVPLIIDGNLADWPEDLMEIQVRDREISQGNHERVLSDNMIRCRSVWDADYLYLAFVVEDTRLNAHQTETDHPALYRDDMVEFLFDPQLDATGQWLPDDFIYHVNILEAVKDDRGLDNGGRDVHWNGAATYAVNVRGTPNDDTDEDSGYHLEVAVPWSEIGRKPVTGLQLGFNFANGDHDNRGRQLFDWMSAWPLRNPEQFGRLRLLSN